MNYYDETIENIKKLIDEGNYQEASFLIKKEMEMPYIPEKYEKVFEELALTIISNVDKPQKQLSANEILDLIENKSKEAPAYLSKLSDFNLRNNMEQIESIFSNGEIANEIKLVLFIMVVSQGIDSNYEINGVKVDEALVQNVFVRMNELDEVLDKTNFESPQISDIASGLARAVLMESFPTVDFDVKEAVETTIEIAKKILVSDNEFTEKEEYYINTYKLLQF